MTTIEFIKQLDNEHTDLVHNMKSAKSIDEAYQIACEEGVTDKKEDFSLEMKKFNDAVNKINKNDLENVLGSASTTEIVSAVSTYTAVAASAASAAAV